jgi:hypothetical protein
VVFPFNKTPLYCLSTSPPPPNTTTSFKIPKAFTYYDMTRRITPQVPPVNYSLELHSHCYTVKPVLN